MALSKERLDRRWTDYSKTALVAVIQDQEVKIYDLGVELGVVTGRIDAFVSANVFVRVWRALRGRVA